jgi:hypothetical protein
MEKVHFINFFICLEFIPVRIWKNDADPTQSRFQLPIHITATMYVELARLCIVSEM